MSSSREEIKRRNDARTERFVARFLDSNEGGVVLIPTPSLAPNPLPQISDKFSGFEKSVGGGANMTDNEKAD
jgi:hypothetical protein